MRPILTILAIFWSSTVYSAVSNWESFEIRHNHILLPVEVNGVASKVMLDSGANVHGVSSKFIAEHGDNLTSGGRMNLEGVFGVETRRTFNNINLALWGSTFNLDNMVETNLPGDVAVLLGTGFFQQFIFQIDYPNRKLRLLTRDALDMKKLRNVKGKVKNNIVNVQVNLNGQKNLWLLLDTGASSGIVTRRLFAEQYGWLDDFDLAQGYGSGANRSALMESFTLPFIEVGPFVVEGVRMYVPAEGESITFGGAGAKATGSHIRNRKISGVLGYEVLKHFVLTVDFKKGHVHLEPPA